MTPEQASKLDKRSKKYKDWVKKHNAASKGLGDTIEKITKKTGIKKAVKFLAGEDCGCDKRKEKLNEEFGYNKAKCLEEEEFNFLSEFFKKGIPSRVNHEDQQKVVAISNRVFNKNQKPSKCGSCLLGIVKELERLFNKY